MKEGRAKKHEKKASGKKVSDELRTLSYSPYIIFCGKIHSIENQAFLFLALPAKRSSLALPGERIMPTGSSQQ